MHTDRWLDVLFGKGDDDFPFWLLTVRINILLLLACAVVVVVATLGAWRRRSGGMPAIEVAALLSLTVVAGVLRFGFASANLMDFGGIPYSRLLYGYKGYFATAQAFSVLYELTARDIEHGLLFNRIAGTLTVPLVYLLCRRLQGIGQHQREHGSGIARSRSGPVPVFPACAALLFATYPLHVLLSASDALAVFSDFLAAGAYLLLLGCGDDGSPPALTTIRFIGALAGLCLLTQVRLENILLLIPVLVWMIVYRGEIGSQRRFVIPALASVGLISGYAYAGATAGAAFQSPIDVALNFDRVTQHLMLNPFFGIPVLLVGTFAVWMLAGAGCGLLALVPWMAALAVCVASSGDSHGAARLFANWLILILPGAAYGFALMARASRRLVHDAAIAALVYLAAQPLLVHSVLAAQHLEILEHVRFREMMATLPATVTAVVVPDDERMRRESHSTFEIFRKYNSIVAAVPGAEHRQLIGLTAYLEQPDKTPCLAGSCVFFFGLPCVPQDVYVATIDQCQELLRGHRTTTLDQASMSAAPFVHCSIFTGALRQELCVPMIKPQTFTLYRIED